MNHVLIATDLSPSSLNAALYGMELYGREDTIYTVLHCYEYLVTVSRMSEPEFVDLAEESVLRFKGSLLAKLPGGSWSIRVAARPGPLDTVLKSYSEAADPPMVVIMGAEHRLDEGETLWRPLVIQRSGLPVLVIPPDVYFRGIRNVLLADDGGILESRDVTALQDLLHRTGARMHVVRMVNETVLVTAHSGPSPIERALGKLPHTYLHRSGDDLLNVVNETIKETAADLLVVVHHERSFLSRIFHASAASQLARHVSVPLLTLQQRT